MLQGLLTGSSLKPRFRDPAHAAAGVLWGHDSSWNNVIAFAEGRDHHGSRQMVCNIAAGTAHRVIHEAQVLGASDDHNTWRAL